MSNQIEFTTAAFGGFEKKQVLDYIFKIHEESDLAEKKHRKNLEDISVAFKELETRALQAEKKTSELEARLSEAETIVARPPAPVVDVEKEQRRLQDAERRERNFQLKIQELEETIRQYETLGSKNTDSHQTFGGEMEVIQKEKELLEIERRSIQESSSQIGRVMLDAHNKADEIVDEAKATAKKILAQAKVAIEEQRIKTNEIIIEHRNSVEKETEGKIKQAQKEAENRLAHADVYAQSLVKDMEMTANETSSHLEHLRKQVELLSLATAETLKKVQEKANISLQSNFSNHEASKPAFESTDKTVFSPEIGTIPAIETPILEIDLSSFTFPSLNPPDYHGE